MKDIEYRAFLDLLMCSDPWPVNNFPHSQEILKNFAHEEAVKRGFANWIDAYHGHIMNIFEREAKDIAAFFDRHGYRVEQGPDYIIVFDPVYVHSGTERRTEYKERHIRNWPEALTFIEERS